MDDFLNYYHKELTFIRAMGAEFARENPGIAGLLQMDATRCEDPHVERLIEAFAFLTARIRKKLDDEYPEITDALLSILYPHYQRPIPSMAIVQFSPSADPTKVAEGFQIPRHVELTTRPVRAVSCRFRTGFSTTLWPIVVESAGLERDRVVIDGKPRESTALLRLTLRCTTAGGWKSLPKLDALRFYLDGDEPAPSSLYECLFNSLCMVWLRGADGKGGQQKVVLPASAVLPVGFGPGEELLPTPANAFPGYVMLQEFMAFPQKFLFFDLVGLAPLAKLGFDGPVEVLFFLRQPPRVNVVIRAENFKLGCAPVVNLFEMVAEPIALNQLQTEYGIVPKYNETHAHEVYSVDRVTTSGSYLVGPVELQPFYAMRPRLEKERNRIRTLDKGDAYWFVHRRPAGRAAKRAPRSCWRSATPIFNRPARPSRQSPRT